MQPQVQEEEPETIRLSELMTVQDAAKELSSEGETITDNDVYNMIHYHRSLRSTKVGNARMVYRSDVEAMKTKKQGEMRAVKDVKAAA